MASKSLYRKYRPQTFADVVGQEHIEQTLRNALASDRVAHAYLFCGPRGTGKTTTARLLAKALLCEKAPTANPCGACQNCIDIADSTHPDVYEIDAASRTGVDNVREEIIGRVAFSPTRGRYKIYIIDEVHMLSTGAFNALLKTLEEPPEHIVFVMCTTEAHKVPQTIVSRCQRFDFHSLSTDQIRVCLEHICEGEGFTFDDEGIDLIAEQAKGGMRDAITALEQVSVFGNGHIGFEAAQNMFGDVDTERLTRIVDCIARRDMPGCFAWVDELGRTGIDTAQVARDLAGYVRNVYVCAIAGRSSALPPMSEELLATLERQAAELGSADRVASMLLVLGDLMVELRGSADARLSLEVALTRMAHVRTELTLESLSARIDALEAGGCASAFAAAAPAAAAAAPTVVPAAAVPVAPAVPAPTAVPAAATVPAASTSPAAAVPVASAAAAPNAPAVNAAAEAQAALAASVPSPAPAAQGTAVQAAAPQGTATSVGPSASAASAPAAGGDASQDPAAASRLRDPGSLRRLWDAAVRYVGQEHAMIPGLMGGAKPHANLRDMKITVELPSDAEFALGTLTRHDSMQWMKDALKRSFGTDVQLEYKLGDTPSAPAPAPVYQQPVAAAPVQAPAPVAPAEPAPAAPAAPVSVPDDPGYDQVPIDQYEDAAAAYEPNVSALFDDAPPMAVPTASHPATAAAAPADEAVFENLPTAPQPGQAQPVSGDTELADMLGDVFSSGVTYRAPDD